MAWQVERECEPVGLRERERRLEELILAGIIGHGWPQCYFIGERGNYIVQQRIDEILAATAAERMPWQIF